MILELEFEFICEEKNRQIFFQILKVEGFILHIYQNICQTPRFQFGDVFELSILLEPLSAKLAFSQDSDWNGAQELHHVGQMVLVLAVACSGVRLKQEVPGGQLECHASRGPDVGGGTVAGSYDDL